MLPSELGSLASLTTMYLFDNDLSGSLPLELSGMTTLTFMNLCYNQLTGSLPPMRGPMKDLYLYNNKLSGSLPPELGNLTSLYSLELYNNHLTGSLPSRLGNLAHLSLLSLYSNQLSGPLPPQLGGLAKLTVLYLSNNQLSGALPPELGGMTILNELYLNNNQLSGSLPRQLSTMRKLTAMYLFDNKFTGQLLLDFSKLQFMTRFTVNNNLFTGPLPSNLENMTYLSVFNAGTNKFTGTLPSWLSGLKGLTQLNVSGNCLSGSVPPAFGSMSHMSTIDLSSNHLTGTLPLQWGALTQMQNFIVASNYLSGTVPLYLGNFTVISTFSLNSNRFHGTVPAAMLRAKVLQFLDLSNNLLSGKLDSSLSSARHLKYISVTDNSLSGCLPPLSAITTLQEIDASHNQFACSLAGVFGFYVQNNSLLNVQLEYNQFSGTLPPELVSLPNIQTIVAVSNCFTGTLPAELCQAQSMQSLIMDGLGASSACSTGIFGMARKFRGTIPACVFSLPNLTSLHLSGNNLVGSIPRNVILSGKLTELYLSHNSLSGSLPEQIQTHPWSLLDVSYNKFGGTLLPSFGSGILAKQHHFVANSSILINNSRISGTIPATVLQLSSISMLGSNMFSCKADKSDVPDTDGDGDKQRYQCGSDGFNYAFYLFLALSGSAVAVFLLIVYHAPATDASMSKWRLSGGSLPPSYQTVHQAVIILCQVAACLTGAILIILVPWYVAASHYYGTYTHQYAWVVSASFLSGLAPGLVEFFFWTVLIMFGIAISRYIAYQSRDAGFQAVVRSNSVPQPTEEEARTVSHIDRVQAYAIFLNINLTAVLGANIAFVYVSLNESSNVVQLAQVALSLWKFMWNTVCVPYLISQLSKQVMPTKHSSGFFRVQVFVSLFNNIAIPCLVVAAQSPSCFRDLLFPPNPLTSSYAVQSCAVVNIDPLVIDCTGTALEPQQTHYTAGYSYSYECSSSFVTYYSASLIYLALTAAVFAPAAYCLLSWVADRTTPDSSLHKWTVWALPRLWKVPELDPPSPSSRGQAHGFYLKVNNLIVNMTVYLGVLLSFGVVFPPVALAMCLAMLSTAYQMHLLVGRLLVNARELGASHVMGTLEADCKNAATADNLTSIVVLVTAFACSFYALFIFDTVGDAEGFARACWALILMPLLPAGVYSAVRYLRSQQEQYKERCSAGVSSGVKVSVEMVTVPGRTVATDQGVKEGRAGSEATISALHV